MGKKGILLVVFVLAISMITVGCGKKNNVVPTEVQPAQTEMQMQGENGVPGEQEMANPEGENPNALDYMAPGHRNARERVKRVQEMRQQALDAQKNDMQRLEQQ